MIRLVTGLAVHELAAPVTAALPANADTRCRSDLLGGYRCYDDDGGSTRIRPDGMGGYRMQRDPGFGGGFGQTCRSSPDLLGGWRTSCY